MAHFRTRPSHRRERSPTAKWIVLGHPADDIIHHGLTAHILLARSGSGDHPKRYAAGQRLAVKHYVPGPTECHVRLISVEGKASKPRPFTLGQVDYAICRELGAYRLDDWRIQWVRSNDTLWTEKALPNLAAGVCEDDAILARFDRHWASKLAWLLRFQLDISCEPRLLAATPSIYTPNRENDPDRDEDRGYVTSEALALKDEPPALRDAEYARHVPAWAERQQALRPLHERVDLARAAIELRGVEMRSELRRLDWLIERERWPDAERQLALIETRLNPARAA
jgi:hypothetical protein